MHVIERREKWTDDRLDEAFMDLKAEMNDRFDRVDDRFDKIEDRFAKLEGRFYSLMLALIGTGGAIVAALTGLLGVAAF